MEPIPLIKDELIGRTVTIQGCTDPTMEQMHGIILDETKHMFLIASQGKSRWIAKDIATFIFPVHQKNISINGSKLKYRPEERVKKAR
jgi:RNase P/RNase MRP subunit p29